MNVGKVSFFASVVILLTTVGSATAATRRYYIAAEDVMWDFAPSNKDLVHCVDHGDCPIPEPWTNSHSFSKVRYIEYTDDSFSQPKAQPEWLGILGPVIRAAVGDTIMVKFCNRSERGDFGMHPHGVRYNKDNEGAHYHGVNSGQHPGEGAQVEPGACFTYSWKADADSGPGGGEVSSKVWWYHSHIDEPAETNMGLLGPIIITRREDARADGTPRDCDREFVTAFFIFDELEGEEPGLMHGINGYIFGNLKGLVMKKGEKVRWHLLGMGNEVDLHTPHWHGKTVQIGAPAVARRTDVVELLPATMITADMKADNKGEWMFHCHVSDHIKAGMLTTYQITE
jgi:FtsP/CotA-like multicopper oxidase with cupredoxin domain